MFPTGGDDEEGTDYMRWGKEGLALILSHSYFLTHGWENRYPSDEEDAFGGKTTNELLDVFLQ